MQKVRYIFKVICVNNNPLSSGILWNNLLLLEVMIWH